MKHYDTLIIGHICKDKNTDHLGNTVYAAGGAVLFSSASARALGHRAGVFTRVSQADGDLLQSFLLPQEDIYCRFGQTTTLMENTYFTPDKEKRRSVCAAQGDPICPDDLPADVTADIYHLAGLVVGDYAPDMIPALSKKGKVAVDVQGYLRNVDRAKGGEMYFADWAKKKELLPYITYLKTDAAEAEILTGTDDRRKAAEMLAEWGAKEVVITHNTEVLVYADGKIFTCPIRARSLAGRTGRGDTTFAAYICERKNASPAEALLTATATVSLKMETPGPFKGTRADVEQYIADYYKGEKKMEKTIKINGMMCPRCEAHVKEALEALDGVETAVPSHTANNAVLTLSADVPDAALKAAVEAAGYQWAE
jgi:sugar/nucleoside kinase (ribokinase family)/copper chaperone CopZ